MNMENFVELNEIIFDIRSIEQQMILVEEIISRHPNVEIKTNAIDELQKIITVLEKRMGTVALSIEENFKK